MRTATRRTGAFTLVELLVVIGIIALLIGILLPVLSGVQTRGRDIKCQSNIRQILQAIHGYVTENKGSMPYGFYWHRSVNNVHPDPYDPSNNWTEAPDNSGSSGDPDNEHPFISWASQVGKYMVKRVSGDNDDLNFPPVLQCPEAAQARNHVVGYAMNWVVAVAPVYEKQASVPINLRTNIQLKPSLVTLMLKETALVWDTAVRPNWENNVGHLIGADIDAQRMAWEGTEYPQQRYYSVKDPFNIFPGGLGQNRPIKLDWPSAPYFNKDPNTSMVERFPYQGNLRFRHGKNKTCNVGFSDGSVRQFTARLNPDNTVANHDAIRRYFMTKWPAGARTNPQRPG